MVRHERPLGVGLGVKSIRQDLTTDRVHLRIQNSKWLRDAGAYAADEAAAIVLRS
jgi:hypothetical protein